jgi:helix-turn-helix protein
VSGKTGLSARERLRAAAVELADALADLLTTNGGDGAVPDGPLTVAQVAAQLHRSPSTVRAWCAAGRFVSAFKLSARDWRVPVEALARFLAAQQPQPARQDAPGRPISPRPETRARPRRARSSGDVDLGAWRRVRP